MGRGAAGGVMAASVRPRLVAGQAVLLVSGRVADMRNKNKVAHGDSGVNRAVGAPRRCADEGRARRHMEQVPAHRHRTVGPQTSITKSP